MLKSGAWLVAPLLFLPFGNAVAQDTTDSGVLPVVDTITPVPAPEIPYGSTGAMQPEMPKELQINNQGGKIEGDANASVASFAKIEEAQKNELAFLANPKYEEHLYTSNASVVIVNETLELKQAITATLIRVPDAYSAFAVLLDKALKILKVRIDIQISGGLWVNFAHAVIGGHHHRIINAGRIHPGEEIPQFPIQRQHL